MRLRRLKFQHAAHLGERLLHAQSASKQVNVAPLEGGGFSEAEPDGAQQSDEQVVPIWQCSRDRFYLARIQVRGFHALKSREFHPLRGIAGDPVVANRCVQCPLGLATPGPSTEAPARLRCGCALIRNASNGRLLGVRVGDEQITKREARDIVTSYARDHASTVLYFDFAGRVDAKVEPSDDVTLGDLGRIAIINADLSGADAARLLSLDLGWSSVARTARLEFADPDEPGGLYAAMSAMWSDVRKLRGIGPTKASKLLHIKRPFAFPLLDRDVRKTYEGRYAKSNDFWREIRADLIDGMDELDSIARHLSASEKADLRRAGRLPNIRLLDILAWKLQNA